jgi:CheY-like chemotaxis protein
VLAPYRPSRPSKGGGKSPSSAAPRKDARPTLCVLIVDDVADTRELYERYFQFRGVRVVTAADGVAAAQAVVHERPDVIVLDLAMPRMTGWEVIEALRRQRATRNIPIVVLSGQSAEDSAYESGADSYLEKPCIPEDLMREVLRVLREPRRRNH